MPFLLLCHDGSQGNRLHITPSSRGCLCDEDDLSGVGAGTAQASKNQGRVEIIGESEAVAETGGS